MIFEKLNVSRFNLVDNILSNGHIKFKITVDNDTSYELLNQLKVFSTSSDYYMWLESTVPYEFNELESDIIKNMHAGESTDIYDIVFMDGGKHNSYHFFLRKADFERFIYLSGGTFMECCNLTAGTIVQDLMDTASESNNKEKYVEGTELKDSGKRESFNTGAVRDDDSSKGDEYLLPFDVVGHLLERSKLLMLADDYKDRELMFKELDDYKLTGDDSHLYTMLIFAAATFYNDDIEKMIMEVAIHYKQGAKKYEPRNWEKGMPISRFISSAIRHYLKAIRGDKDEPHERAFVWNIMGAIHIAKIMPSLNDFVLTNEQLSNFGFSVNLESVRNSSGTIGEELDK